MSNQEGDLCHISPSFFLWLPKTEEPSFIEGFLPPLFLFMPVKKVADQNTKIVSTKVSPLQYKQLDDFCKRKGFGSLYEMMQYIFYIMLKFDDISHGASPENEDQINDFLRPFLEVEKPFDYIIAARKDSGTYGGAYSKGKTGDINFIVVRDGDFISKFHKEGEELKVSHNVDEAALSVILAGRPGLKGQIRAVMSANKTGSFLECLRILLNDAMPDVENMLRNNALDYAMNEYGTVPKKTHDATSENICNKQI